MGMGASWGSPPTKCSGRRASRRAYLSAKTSYSGSGILVLSARMIVQSGRAGKPETVMGADELARTGRRVVKAACPHDCPDTCAMDITVENGVAIDIRGGAMPFTACTLCTKVAKYLDRTYSDQRVAHPLRRVGPKGPGAGYLERIAWDE